ncbi:hypothetical protein ACJMK2_017713 [Sinanodonta woodiana]|uniref:P/Homo B domain-containing protein n=1 Tax=Sinanodonta woodiana TaxID=1069815 RepID=A0ABD3UB70_SINWO
MTAYLELICGVQCYLNKSAPLSDKSTFTGLVEQGWTISGLRLLSNTYTTDISEAEAITHGYNITDISSNSWGPPDSYGYSAPGVLTVAAFKLGVAKGREGKGVIYVWAAGNGGTSDNCNADGYANSIYTVTISSVSINGQPAWYSEVCAPALAVTYSGDKHQRYMCTTSNANSCIANTEGTSFSAPQAKQIMMTFNKYFSPDLTSRDVQRLTVKTAKYHNLREAAEFGFSLNGAGNNATIIMMKQYSFETSVGQMFGYGLMDAEAMVRYSKTWKTVPKQEIFKSSISAPSWVLISTLTTLFGAILVGITCPIKYLEHVQVHTIFRSSERAYVELDLNSPSGTRCKLMTQKMFDKGFSGQQEWTFTSVQFWGEQPNGNWTLTFKIPSNQTGSPDEIDEK